MKVDPKEVKIIDRELVVKNTNYKNPGALLPVILITSLLALGVFLFGFPVWAYGGAVLAGVFFGALASTPDSICGECNGPHVLTAFHSKKEYLKQPLNFKIENFESDSIYRQAYFSYLENEPWHIPVVEKRWGEEFSEMNKIMSKRIKHKEQQAVENQFLTFSETMKEISKAEGIE